MDEPDQIPLAIALAEQDTESADSEPAGIRPVQRRAAGIMRMWAIAKSIDLQPQ